MNCCTGEEPKKEEIMERKATPLTKEKEEKKGAAKPEIKDKFAEVTAMRVR